MVSPAKILQSASSSELDQAHRLIIEGKTGAARGHTKMLRIISALEQLGYTSAKEMVAARESRERIASQQTTHFTSETERYIEAGYSSAQAEKLAAWSIEHQQTPSPEKAREITGGISFKTFAEREAAKAAPPPTAIYAAEDIPRADPLRYTFGEAAGISLRKIPEGARQILGGFFTEMDISGGVRYIAEPFKETGRLRGEKEIAIYEPTFGTITPTTETGFREFKGTLFGFAEYQKTEAGEAGRYLGMTKEAASVRLSEDIIKEITPEYQAKVDRGELTIKQAEAQLKKEYEKEFKKKAAIVEQAFARQPTGLYERTGKKITELAPSVAETGLLFTPIGGAYFVGRGFGQAVEAETLLGKGLGVATIGVGFTGISITMAGLRASLTKGKIMEAVSRKPDIKFGVRQELKEGYVRDYLKTKYKVGDVSVIKETEIISRQLPGQPQIYAMTGEGSVVVRTTEEFTGRTIYSTSFGKFKGLGYGFKPGATGFQPSLVTGKVTKEFEMFAKITKEKPLAYKARAELYAPSEDLTLGAISKSAEERILSLSGEVKDLSKRWATPSGVEIERGKFLFDVEDIALLKVVKPSKDGVKRFIRPGDIKRTPFSKTFGKQEQIIEARTQQQIRSSLVGEKLTKPTITTFKGAKPTAILKEKVILATSLDMAQLSAVLSRARLTPAQAYSFQQAGFLRSDLMPRLGTSLAPQYSFKMRLAELQTEAQMQAQLTQPRIKTKPEIDISPGLTGGFFFPTPSFPELKFGKGEAEMIKTKQPQQYQPSLTSASLNITAPKIPKIYKIGAGAISLRPIIRKK